MQCEKKGKVRVVGIEQIQIAKVEGVIPGNSSEKGVEQVKPFVIKLRIVNTKNFVEVCGGTFHRGKIAVVKDDSQRKLPEVVAMEFELLDALAKLLHLGFLRIIKKQILRTAVVQTHLAHKRSLGVVKMPALGLDVAAGFAGLFFLPFRHDVVIGGDAQKSFEQKRECLRRGLLEGQHLNEVIIHP